MRARPHLVFDPEFGHATQLVSVRVCGAPSHGIPLGREVTCERPQDHAGLHRWGKPGSMVVEWGPERSPLPRKDNS